MPSTARQKSIVLLCSTAPPTVCGIGDYTARLAAALGEERVRVNVWTRETVGAGGAWDGSALRTLAGRLRGADRPALLHLQYETALYDHRPGFPLAVARAARRAGVPLVTTFHSLDGPSAWGRAHRIALLPLLPGSDAVTVCSERQFRALQRLPGRFRTKVHLVPVGSNVPVAATPRDRFASPASPLRLVYFGFVWRGKQIETAVRALAAVNEESGPARLTIVGAIREEAYREETLALAASVGVADRVTFTGELSVSEISCTLAHADIALLPYPTGASTGHGTLAAALEHSLPIVTTDLPANRSPLFADGDNLLLAPAGNDEIFVRQTVRLAKDAALRRRLSIGAMRLAESFSWPTIAGRILALPVYRAALEGAIS